MGAWVTDGDGKDSITPLTSLKAALTNTKITFAKGYKNARSTDKSLFSEALAVANQSSKILLFLGEDNGLSG